MTEILDNLIDGKILPTFDGNLSEEELFYLSLKNKSFVDFLISKKELKEKYPSILYLPKHFLLLNEGDEYFLPIIDDTPDNFESYSTTMYKYNFSKKIYEGVIYINITKWIKTCSSLYFSSKTDAKKYIIDEMSKDLI